MKELLGRKIAERVINGSLIGVGTGSTVDACIAAIAHRIQSESLKVSCITTSLQSAHACYGAGFSVVDAGCGISEVDWGFDGADEVDPQFRLIKGRGAALLREKLVAKLCKEFVIVIDDSKLVDVLGSKVAVPVEIVPSSLGHCLKIIKSLGSAAITLRDGLPGKHGPVITEHGNLILDVTFKEITPNTHSLLKNISGVVETGIFPDEATELLIAHKDEVISRRK